MPPSEQERLRALPAVDRVIEGLGADVPHVVAAEAARSAIEEARERAPGYVREPTTGRETP
jgi:hypothetical protein